MKRLAVVGMVLATLWTPATAVLAQTGADCVAIAADAERLACYDGLFRAPQADATAPFVVQSEQLIPARPSGRERATLSVACDAGTLRIAFAFAGNQLSALGNDAGLTLQYDLQAARSRTLPVNADNTALLLSGADAQSFITGLRGATNVTARVTPANNRSLSVRFRVDRVAEQLFAIAQQCTP